MVAAIIVLAAVLQVMRKKRQVPVAIATTPVEQTPTAPPMATPVDTSLATLKLLSDTSAGKIAFDDQPAADFQDGQWSLDKIPAGEHKVKFESAKGDATFTFSSAANSIPLLKEPIVSKGVLAILASSTSDHLRIYSSQPSTKLSLDGQSSVDIPADGLDIPSISAGPHQLSITRGGDQYKLDVEAAPAPALNLFLESGQSLGGLIVAVGQDGAKVFLNGKAQPQLTQNGQLRIPNLELKDYSVRVSKSGFVDPPEQKIRIRKGEQAKLSFTLQAVPHLASLAIQGGIPGTTVLIDQVSVGTVQSDGTLNLATVNPGDHTIELRKDRFKWKQLKKHFVVGAAVSLAAADMALEAAPGELKITYTPPDAQVTLTKAGETAIKVTPGGPLSLPAGAYTLTAKTSDNFSRSTTVEIAAGQSKNLDFSLAPDGMSKWDDPSGWKQDKGAFTRKGGEVVMYNLSPTSGTFVFSALLSKGHRLQWMLNCIDANDYILFQMDDNNFYRTVVSNGQKGEEVKIPHKNEKKSFRSILIRVGPSEIVHQIRQGDAWVVLDRFSPAGSNLSAGKFGFYIPGGDQVALANFAHYVDLSAK